MSLDIPNNFTVKTDIGSFHIKITNRDYIRVGAKNNCVQIAYNTKTNTANLDWLGTARGGCEVNGKDIRGDDTIIMVDLAFTILQQLYPNVNPLVSLCDSSTFNCRLPNNKPVSMSLMKYNLLLTGKTHYQSKFNATLKYNESLDAYNAFIKNRENSDLFDKSYDFNNNDLNALLQPILKSSSNWGEFFEKVYIEFGRNTCALMYNWYLDVYGFLAKQAIHTDWVIDISNRPKISYSIVSKNNTKNFTRKQFVYNPYEFGGGGYYPTLISYRKIVKNHQLWAKLVDSCE
jgi:hypothetical protein